MQQKRIGSDTYNNIYESKIRYCLYKMAGTKGHILYTFSYWEVWKRQIFSTVTESVSMLTSSQREENCVEKDMKELLGEINNIVYLDCGGGLYKCINVSGLIKMHS